MSIKRATTVIGRKIFKLQNKEKEISRQNVQQKPTLCKRSVHTFVLDYDSLHGNFKIKHQIVMMKRTGLKTTNHYRTMQGARDGECKL